MSSFLEVGASHSRPRPRPGSLSESEEEIERRKVGTMKALVESRHPSFKDLDDAMIRRFLRARNGDVEKGSAMLVKHLQWRKEFVPNGGFRAEEVMGSGLCNNELFLQGCDRMGRPILVALAAHHKPIASNDEFKRYITYVSDKIFSRMPSGVEKFIAITDFKGYGYANNDVRAFIAGLSFLQDNCPERLAKMFFVHVPHIFMAAWKLISPFLDKNTKKKITFVESKKMKATMLQDIDVAQLPEIFGGKLKLVPIQQS